MQLSPGAVVGGRYLVEKKIGSGAMGEVWAGEHIGVGYRVAIKTMLAEGATDREVVERFKREALILGRIRSDYVARILDFVQDSTYGLVLVLDLIEGEVFSAMIRRTKLSVEEAIEFGIDVVSGLVDLHNENIVHRDLKPSNVIMEPHRGGKSRAIIVDFGVSRLIQREGEVDEMNNLTKAGMALGTLEYMAPEQMLDSRQATGVSDIYALGMMLFRAVAGVHAFGNANEIELTRSKLLKETPPLVTGRDDAAAKGFEAVVARATKKKAAERYQSAEEMLEELTSLREKLKEPAGGSAEKASPNARKSEAPPASARAPASVRAPASTRKPGSVRPPAPAIASPIVIDMDPAPMSARSARESMQLMAPGVSRPVFVISIVGALVAGLVLGGLLLGGGSDSEAGAGAEAADAAATIAPPPPPPPPPAPTQTTAADAADAGAKDAGKKPRAPGGGALPGKPKP
jgi:serine/threonine protein kinase